MQVNLPRSSGPRTSGRCDLDASRSSFDGIPEAWPLLLNREQLSAFLTISPDTLQRICPVQPLALGAKLIRWRRTDIEAWVAGMPLRPRPDKLSYAAENIVPIELAGEARRVGAIERARRRASGNLGKATWH